MYIHKDRLFCIDVQQRLDYSEPICSTNTVQPIYNLAMCMCLLCFTLDTLHGGPTRNTKDTSMTVEHKYMPLSMTNVCTYILTTTLLPTVMAHCWLLHLLRQASTIL